MGVVRHAYSAAGDNTEVEPRLNRQGSSVVIDQYLQWSIEGRVFAANAGVDTTAITFETAFDATAPDLHIHVPSGITIIPLYIGVNYDAVGTEATMEIMALASNTGDSSATGTGITIKPMRVDRPNASLCTATSAVDGSGVTDPYAGNFLEFWHESRPLTDTVATSQNDRIGLLFEWTASESIPPVIVGAAAGSVLAVYAASEAGTGFVTAVWAELPTSEVT